MKNMTQKNGAIDDLAKIFKVLSEPNRLLIIEKIAEGIQCNCELGDALDMAPNLISHHLSVLRDAKLIKTKRAVEDARWVYYSIDTETMEKLRIFFNEFFNPARIKRRLPSCGPGFIIKESVFKHED